MPSLTYYDSPIGTILLAAEGKALTGLWFMEQKHFPAEYIGCKVSKQPTQILIDSRNWLERYFAGENPDAAELALAPRGSDFQHRVWEILRNIPYGETITYGKIAKMLEQDSGRKVSAQAVGGAVGRNPISIIIPCHRVIGAKGSLTGYAGGLEKKIALLELEQNAKKLPVK